MCVFLVDVWVDLGNWIPTKEGGLTVGMELKLDSQINKIWVYTKIWYGVNTKHIKGPIHGFNHNRNLVDV